MYTIDEAAMITGLTTRTLRNYLKSEILHSSKVSGIWQFSEADIEHFMMHPSVHPSIQAKRHAIVYDFLSGQDNTENEICILLDRTADKKEAGKISDFFCSAAENTSHFRFSFAYEEGKVHVILKGKESEIRRIMDEFYLR